MKKTDWIVVLFVLIIAGLSFLLFCLRNNNEQAWLTIYQDGQVIKQVSVTQNQTFDVHSSNGYNTVVIQDGYVSVSNADCKNKICVHHYKIHRTGETIACLPHKLVLVIEDSDKQLVLGGGNG